MALLKLAITKIVFETFTNDRRRRSELKYNVTPFFDYSLYIEHYYSVQENIVQNLLNIVGTHDKF